MVQNLLITPWDVWAVYRMGPQMHSFQSDDERGLLFDRAAHRWGQLAGLDFREATVGKAVRAAEHAARLDRRTPHPLGGVAVWNKKLERMQRRTSNSGMDDKLVFRAFRLGATPHKVDVRAQVLGVVRCEEVAALLSEERRIHAIVTGPAFDGERATEAEMGWLRHRTIAPGIAAPTRPHVGEDGWAEGYMGEFVDGVTWTQEDPLDRVLRVDAWRGGSKVTTYAAVVTVGLCPRLLYPESGLEPWMVYAERAQDRDGNAFPVEWMLGGRIADPKDIKARTEYDLRRAMSIRGDYRDHSDYIPPVTDRAIKHAGRVHDQVSSGQSPTEAARFIGIACARVTGATPLEVNDRVAALTDLYGGTELGMALEHPFAQEAWMRGFVFGEPFVTDAYQHQWDMHYLAAAMPTVTSRLGDGHGPYQGYTTGASRRAVCFDSHYATERPPRRPNLWVQVAEPGAGKSFTIGKFASEDVDRGITTLVNDPAGPLANLCELPDFAPYAEHIDMLDAAPGTLNPPGLIADPVLEAFMEKNDDQDAQRLRWLRAMSLAEQERGSLTTDVARMCMEADLYRHRDTREVLREARARVKWTVDRTTWDLVEALEAVASDEGSEHARRIARSLRMAAESPRTFLLFPARGDATDVHTVTGKTLTVITSKGLRLPDDETPREDWTQDELAAVPLFHLSTFFTTRLAYGKPRRERASLYLDEMKEPLRTASGRSLLSRLGTDSSKWNLYVHIASQNPEDVMKGDTLNYVAGAHIGRIRNREIAERALPLLKVQDKGYARTIQELDNGEWITRDVDGNVERWRVDAEHLPERKAALDTNPVPDGVGEWNLDAVVA